MIRQNTALPHFATLASANEMLDLTDLLVAPPASVWPRNQRTRYGWPELQAASTPLLRRTSPSCMLTSVVAILLASPPIHAVLLASKELARKDTD
ncbi:hypothetical protein SPRG_07205 [Saprolegnia parasitica CBS 223.65]|uniref:Uncharacterized protein n=1 Tax=Saprolegnia parasitica (strain CBS 223.65) TaxID=695850 RepID=A0A067CN08_SAPPC|nr:hypothetical protein SPRG_07205 [Saprolegnia parasitica CBS 223.65]KDO27931.1 hypothetical protein SPRG_07205 [Saprolegnia parasitica CBS 223.65]|eukprot:XP_012201387.1 hypothetical protein SPRG_07205 [Saprolegnia parasitica CBS 223.65]